MKSPKQKSRRRSVRWLRAWDKRERELAHIASVARTPHSVLKYRWHESFRRIRDRVLKELSK